MKQRHAIVLPGEPPGLIEIDPEWPGRTRLRIPASEPLPMLGPARLEPRVGPRRRRASFDRLGWTGRGGDDARRWSRHLDPHLRRIHQALARGGFYATLTPAGLLVHLPSTIPKPNGVELLRDTGEALARGLALIAAEPDVDGIRLGTTTEEATGACSICWETLEGTPETCEACGARQHPECAEWAGGCGRFACEGAVASRVA